MIINADCREVLATLAPNSVDAVVTDPPYHLTSVVKRFGKEGSAPAKHGKDGLYARQSKGFMGQTWDGGDISFDADLWAAVMRVLKPGGHLLAFSGSRTYHRMACAIEDAGFEIRDMVGWLYGSGYPKSHNQKDEFEGRGTALKPAQEPVCMARKPLIGTVRQNLEQWGTGALMIDVCRVPLNGDADASQLRTMNRGQRTEDMNGQSWGLSKLGGDEVAVVRSEGRWPANIIHDGSDEVLDAFPNAPGQLARASSSDERKTQNVYGAMKRGSGGAEPRADAGSAARFFYCSKASKIDREEGNDHPTVKPTDLMRYLCRLVTPPGGIVLDPFAGSGSTGKAAHLEGFNFIGIELDPKFAAIASRRANCAIMDFDALELIG